MSGQNRTGGFPRRHRTQRVTIANRRTALELDSLGWVAWSECMQEVLLSGKRLLSCSFKNMLDFNVHPQITLCGKNASSEMDRERERGLAPDYNLQYSEYSCAHYAPIFRSSIIFQVWVVTEVGEHYIPFLARLVCMKGGIVYSGLSWNNNSNHRHWFYWEEWACGVAVFAF